MKSENRSYDYKGIHVVVDDEGTFAATINGNVITADGLAELYDEIDERLDEADDEPDAMPEPQYAVIRSGNAYSIVPTRLLDKVGEVEVVTKTITIEVAERYLEDMLDDDDDPRCVCGVYRSEHALCGCPEGFQRAGSWAVEREAIQHMSDDMFDRIYHSH